MPTFERFTMPDAGEGLTEVGREPRRTGHGDLGPVDVRPEVGAQVLDDDESAG